MTSLVARVDAPSASRLSWAGLGWYRMALVQVMRTRCCGDTPPLAEPPQMSACGLGAGLAGIDRAVASGGDLGAAARDYFAAADCLFKNNAAQAFGLRDPADGAQLRNLLDLVSGK